MRGKASMMKVGRGKKRKVVLTSSVKDAFEKAMDSQDTMYAVCGALCGLPDTDTAAFFHRGCRVKLA